MENTHIYVYVYKEERAIEIYFVISHATKY